MILCNGRTMAGRVVRRNTLGAQAYAREDRQMLDCTLRNVDEIIAEMRIN